MEEKRAAAASTAVGIEGPSPIPDVALECVLGYADDPRDRAAVSLVYRRWHRLDALTRAHVTVAFCYAASPSLLRRHFPRVESLKLKAKPRAAMFNLIPDDWGGHAPTPPRTSTASRPSTSAAWSSTTTPSPSSAPAGTCSRPSASTSAPASPPTPSLLARSCRCLRTLFLEESNIMDHDGEWLWKLAINNSVLETLNFYMTDL